MNWYRIVVLILVITLGLGLSGMFVLRRVADNLVKTLGVPHRQKQLHTPGDYNLDYNDITIKTRDNIELKGWYIKGSGEKLVIFSHPGSFTKWGWNIDDLGPGRTDDSYGKNVDFLPFMKELVDAGYDVIMYDQRNHGESDSSPSGVHDVINDGHLDVVAAVEYANQDPVLKELPKALVLFCQSSFSGMVAMNNYPNVFEESNVKAFIANQSTELKDFYKAYGLPNIILNEIERAYVRGGMTEMDEFNPMKWIEGINIPTMMVQNTNDPWTNVDHVRKVYESLDIEKEGLFVEMEAHRFAAYNYFNNHADQAVEFLDKYLD